ncbi:MAG: FecR domain-containing protein [Chloroflexi bacterium]|nr:FecR domain-containing protein [Chloroflexota bacterium]
MLRKQLFITSLSLIIAALACNAPFGDSGRAASLSELRNAVQSKGDANAQFKPATDGDKIISSGGVKTGTDSRVRISVTDGTIIRLGDNTEFVLKELSATSNDPITNITLVSGRMWVAVTSALGNGKFDVNTPVGVASVRGSFMSVEIFQATGQMIVTCLEGLCRLASLASGRFVDLKTAEQSEIPGTGQDPTPPKKIDLKQVNDWRAIFPEAAQHVLAVGTPGAQPTATRVGAGGAISGTAVGGSTSGVGLTACDHPYFPLRPGATWTYSTESGSMTWTVTGVRGDKNNATADLMVTTGQMQMTQSIQCSGSNGILVGILIGLNLGSSGNMTMTRSNASGSFLPPADQLKPGFAWQASSEVQMQISGGTVTMSVTGKPVEQYKVASNNKVTVAGKLYDGLQVTGSMLIQDVTITLPNVPVAPATRISGAMNSVYAKGVGLVQQTSQVEGQSSTMTLTSFRVP